MTPHIHHIGLHSGCHSREHFGSPNREIGSTNQLFGRRWKKCIAAKKRTKSSRTSKRQSFSGIRVGSALKSPSLADQRKLHEHRGVSDLQPIIFRLTFPEESTPLPFNPSQPSFFHCF